MDSIPWNSCRTCLRGENVGPIFHHPEHHNIYSNIIFTVTGIKVEINDSLPQAMCSSCINFINDSLKFRRKCEETNMQLLSKINCKERLDIKTETSLKVENDDGKIEIENGDGKIENGDGKIEIENGNGKIEIENDNGKIEIENGNGKIVTIDISLMIPIDDNFKDYDDNITLDSFKFDKAVSPRDVNISNGTDCMEDFNLDNGIEENLNANNGRPKKRTRVSKKDNARKKISKKDTNKETVECEYCHKVLTSKLSLRNHYKIHTGFDFVCEHCGKKFITKRLLLMHCRAKHGYEKTDKCSYCDYRASNAEQVKIHERLHTGERPYVCTECNAGFHRNSSYLQHIAIHLPDKNVQCEQCPARFKSVTLMRIHMSRHRGPSHIFWCKLCSHSFARRRNASRHLQRVHHMSPDMQHIDRRKIV